MSAISTAFLRDFEWGEAGNTHACKILLQECLLCESIPELLLYKRKIKLHNVQGQTIFESILIQPLSRTETSNNSPIFFKSHKKFSAQFKRVLGLFFSPLLLSMPGYQSLKRIIVSTALLWEISARCGLIVRCAATWKLLQGKERRLCSHLNHSVVGKTAGFVACNVRSTLPNRA